MKNFINSKNMYAFILVIILIITSFYLFKQNNYIPPENSPEIGLVDVNNSGDAMSQPYVKYDLMDWFDIDLFSERAHEYFPKEMADFLVSYNLCTHWAGEYSEDPERAEQIKQGAEKSCIDFDTSEKFIEKKYSNDSRLQEMKNIKNDIKQNGGAGNTEYSFIWNDPKGESKVLNKYTEAKAQWILQTVDEQMQEYDDLVKVKGIKEEFDDIKLRLSIQKSYLDTIIPHMEYLHPITRRQVEDLRDNKDFIARALKN